MKLKYSILQDGNFPGAMSKLSAFNFKSQKASYNFMRIAKAVEQEGKLAQEQYAKLLKSFAATDEKGEFIPFDGKPDTFYVSEEKQPEFKKAQLEFNELEFEINRYPIKLDDLEGSELTPIDLAALEPLLEPEVPVLQVVKNETQSEAPGLQ